MVKTNVRNWGNYGQSVTQGNAAKLQGLGFALRAAGAPVGVPDQVLDLAVTEGDNEGALDCMWKPTRGATSYELETCADPNLPNTWAHRDTVTASKATLSGLTSGARTWVRVRAIGTGGLKGPWSDPAVKVVP